MLKLSPTQAAYLAGLVDGEGCIAIHRQKHRKTRSGLYYRTDVTVSNTNQDVLVWAKKVTGLGSIRGRQLKMRNSKFSWRWSVSGNGAVLLVRLISPYLIIKREQARLLLSFRAQVSRGGKPLTDGQLEFREQCYHQSRTLNMRGKVPYREERA